jgi:hypothetical protein
VRRSRTSGSLARRALLAGLLALPLSASAWIPEPERAWTAVAQTNGSSGRGGPLAFPVALLGSDGAIAATGRLSLGPGGRARLELAHADGSTEVHERSGAEYRVLRNGRPADRALELVPPLAVLQATDAAAVADALRAMGANPAAVDLGMDGTHDCWVLGGRDAGSFAASARPALWVDQESQQPVRIDAATGTQYRFGDVASREGARFPSRIDVLASGWPPWRIEIQNGAAAPAGAAVAP